ncbi:low temperature requirement protein A [Nocardioides sp. SYSU D00038]|uniref:low temperature requirement protein A n=1 Tax=Nocardioides sp. SYSU D00038 TaxID=2812554 RepID=UPI001F079E8D|nr:low temperature requirement protein A [Nocardioides sp. SYSU D00038]
MPERTHHSRMTMSGRDPHEAHRAATPLELLFDLTFVIAFGAAADELAHLVTDDHVVEGIVGFLFATFAVSWAWINFTWFASAYDTDDWVYRLTTMVQMAGVLILALGLRHMFESLTHGGHVDNSQMVLGYVVMRVPMLFQWWRAGRQDPARSRVCRTMFVSVAAAQVGWLVLLWLDLDVVPMFVGVVVLGLVEVSGPVLAERIDGGTPWHPHHIAERYGLLVIIALGEGLLGTVAALSVLVGDGWTLDVALLGLAGTALTFGLWWTYFVIPHGAVLHARRERSFGWGYGHIPLFGAVVAVGAGLHAAAYELEHHTTLSTTGTVLTVAVPIAAYVVLMYVLYGTLTRSLDPFHVVLVMVSGVVVALGVGLAAAGVPLVWCLLVLALVPWVTVVGYELVGHRHNEEVLSSLAGAADAGSDRSA